MVTALHIIHILIAMGIIGLVLIQHGKGADAGAAFGAGAAGGVSGSVFGAKGSGNFLSRSTAILATLFFLTSLALAYFTKNAEAPKSLLEGVGQQSVQVQKPAAPKPAEKKSDIPELPAAPSESSGGGAANSGSTNSGATNSGAKNAPANNDANKGAAANAPAQKPADVPAKP